MKDLKVFIYCRVLDEKAKDLLNYQEHELTDLSKYFDMRIVGVVKEVSSGKNFCSYSIDVYKRQHQCF